MGHSRLGLLPQSYRWQEVVGLLVQGGSAAAVAEATAEAAEEGLRLAARDLGLRHVFHLLTQITLAAGESDFALSLRDAGVTVPPNPSLFDLLGGFAQAVDERLLENRNRTDFSEMAQMAAAEAIATLVDARAEGLYGATPVEVKDAVASLSTETGFSSLGHEFFSRFIHRFLTYHLSRELSAHVGPGLRFADVDAHAAFLQQLRVTCEEAAIIVRRFSGQWYRKTNYETGITPAKVRDFVHGAFTKLRAELKVRGEARVSA
jgi:hypothetical protein